MFAMMMDELPRQPASLHDHLWLYMIFHDAARLCLIFHDCPGTVHHVWLFEQFLSTFHDASEYPSLLHRVMSAPTELHDFLLRTSVRE